MASVINVAEGGQFGYNAVAIEDLVDASSTGSQLHYPPHVGGPDFDDAAMSLTANISLGGVQTTYTGNIAESSGRCINTLHDRVAEQRLPVR